MYESVVEKIRQLPWEDYNPRKIIFISHGTAVEFAGSLRAALKVYPNNENLLAMAAGELNTDNLSFEDYQKRGDHWEFLYHFCGKNKIHGDVVGEKISTAVETYHHSISILGDDSVRAMTIFSREQELPKIFKQILKAHDWEKLELGFFKYYLERHIELDSVDGGHGDLTKDFFLGQGELFSFYQIRLRLYESLQ